MGDEILEINGRSTENIPHADAIALIKSGGNRVHLLIHRSNKPVYYGKLYKFLAMNNDREVQWLARSSSDRAVWVRVLSGGNVFVFLGRTLYSHGASLQAGLLELSKARFVSVVYDISKQRYL